MRRTLSVAAGFAAAAIAFAAASANATSVRVTVTNISPALGMAMTPLWVGFHDGGFDGFDVGTPAGTTFERIAEDGDFGPLGAQFSMDPTRVGGAVSGVPILPGDTFSAVFDVDLAGANRFFSYAAMVVPSNDYFIGNDDPMARDLSGLPGVGSMSFFIGTPGSVYDAGTEVNDFNFSAGNFLFPGLPVGQTGLNEGADENGTVELVANAFASFLNDPGGLDFSSLDFNTYPQGIARVDVAVVSEPATLGLIMATLGGLALVRRRRTED